MTESVLFWMMPPNNEMPIISPFDMITKDSIKASIGCCTTGPSGIVSVTGKLQRKTQRAQFLRYMRPIEAMKCTISNGFPSRISGISESLLFKKSRSSGGSDLLKYSSRTAEIIRSIH